jgi:hypothetical protein
MFFKNKIVPPGVSGKAPEFNPTSIEKDILASELLLLSLGDFEELNFKIDTSLFMDEISEFEKDWVDYLPRTDRSNNRLGLSLTNLPGKSHRDNPSRPQASLELGRRVSELEFSEKTKLYEKCTSLHHLLDEFQPLGRSFIVKSNIGGYFVPHRDHPTMPRESFRIIVFLNNCGPLQYDWISETNNKLIIEHGRAYYVNTRKTHRTISWVDNSLHLIMNVPFTSENVAKLVSKIHHTH